MNGKMTTRNYQQLNLKKQEQNELSKQLEQVQSHRNRDDMESISWFLERNLTGKGLDVFEA